MSGMSPTDPKSPRRWTRVLLGIALWLAIGYAAWYLALWLFPVPMGTFTGASAEEVARKFERMWWGNVLIYVALNVVVYGLAPWAWRRWHGRHLPQP